MKKSLFLLLIVVLLTPFTASAQDDTEKTPETSKKTEDKQRQILLYGIDSEVLEVLSSLQSESIDRYNPILKDLILEMKKPEIISKIFQLWESTDWKDGVEAAESELQKVLNDDLYDKKVIQSVISYLGRMPENADIKLLAELSESRDTEIAAAAIRSIGRIAEKKIPESAEETGQILLERLTDEDAYAEEALVDSIIVTLGHLKYTPAADELLSIMEDEGAVKGHRRFACVSLGKIGREEDYNSIETLYFSSDDANLRAYALAGIAEFPRDSSDILIQALKRDSFWRIRLTAAEKLGSIPVDKSIENSLSELLRYKASSDPVKKVKIAAMKSLGKYKSKENREFLLDYYSGENHSPELRLTALDVLVENKIDGTVEAVKEVLDKHWEKDLQRFMEFTCRNLSRAEWKKLEPLFDRMLDSPNWLIQAYGVKGIRKNKLLTLESRIKELDNDETDVRLLREIRR